MEQLGINWKMLLGQVVNFIILFWLLKRFAYKPFLSVLEQRRTKIEEGVKKSEEAEKTLQKTRTLEREIKKSGEERAKTVLKEAEIEAANRVQAAISSAEEEKKKIIEDAKILAQKEIAEKKEEQRGQNQEYVFFLAEKFLKEKMDKEKDKKLLEEIISGLK